jgi:DNA-binding response OmpR family regulator
MMHLGSSALILEDDKELALTLADFLSLQGFESKIANTITDAINITSNEEFLFYLLDVKLPDGNSFSFLSDLRSCNDYTPAIFITSLIDKISVLSGFNAGCDDYIKKPFDLDELAAKIKVLLRRSYGIDDSGDIMIGKDTLFKPKDGLLLHKEGQTFLTQKEKSLLCLLIKNKNNLTTKELIASEIWEDDFSDGALRVYISKLKSILKDNLISIRGEGYKLLA